MSAFFCSKKDLESVVCSRERYTCNSFTWLKLYLLRDLLAFAMNVECVTLTYDCKFASGNNYFFHIPWA